MANLLTIEGKLDLAMKYINKALDIAPFSSVNVNYKGFLFYMMEQYDKALPYFKQSLLIQPELPFPVVFIGACDLLAGNLQEGLNYFENLPEDSSGFLSKLGGTAISHAMMGNISKANEGISKLETFFGTPSEANALNFITLCHIQLNNIEKAMELINQSVENHFPMVLLLPTEPLAKPLHELPAFKTIMQKLIGSDNREEPQRKYKKLLFKDQELKKYKTRLIDLMEQKDLYLDPELTLRSLAEYMNLPANHMSQLLNKGFNQNFTEYVNTYRLEHFKKLLQTTDSHHLTVLALAYDSGFNSKTVFNTFFKNKEGITPKAYWNQIKK